MADKSRSRRIGFQASQWNPPARMVEIAHERTVDITRVFLSGAVWAPLDFNILAQSCYMQGIKDLVDALTQRGLVITPREAEMTADEGTVYWP